MSSVIYKLSRPDSEYLAYCRHEKNNSALQSSEIVFLTGFMSDMSGTKAAFLREFCADRNWTITTFDYYGHGRSSGKFELGTISRWLEDTLAIIDELTSGPLILVGSSMGGWLMTLAALMRPNRVKALVGIASAPDFTEALIWRELPAPTQSKLMTEGIIYTPSNYSESGYPITRELIEDGRKNLILNKPILLNLPIRLLHGTQDEDVPWQYSQRLMESVKSQNVILTLIKGGDHRLSSPEDLAQLGLNLENLQQGA